MPPTHLPLVPPTILQAHQVHEPNDPRFRACARLLQALWREAEELPIGHHTDADGVLRQLGSRLSDGAATGRNFLTREVARLAWHEAVYREPGALVDEERLWSNLLSSHPLTFNLFGPLRLDPTLATTMLRKLCPDLAEATVTAVRFEHSPGRGDSMLTGDGTAFDLALNYARADDRRGLVAIEVKYSEDCTERQKPLRPETHAAFIASTLFRDAADPALQASPVQQFAREHVLTQASLSRGDQDEARFVVVAPRRNAAVWDACRRYAGHLAEPTDAHASFATWAIEEVVDALAEAGDPTYAAAFADRYLAFDKVDALIAASAPFCA